MCRSVLISKTWDFLEIKVEHLEIAEHKFKIVELTSLDIRPGAIPSSSFQSAPPPDIRPGNLRPSPQTSDLRTYPP